MDLTCLPSRRHMAAWEARSSRAGGAPDCHQNQQNRTIQFAKPDSPVFAASSRSFWFLFDSCHEYIFVTPLGNRSSPAMAHYGMEIYSNNSMPSIYTNPKVWYTNYLPIGNSFDPSCENYFGRVDQEKIPPQFIGSIFTTYGYATSHADEWFLRPK
jgi:hypothetical protein